MHSAEVELDELTLKSKTLNVNRVGALYYITFPSFDETGLVRHLYSTRRGGVSEGYLGPMNLGFHRGDDENAVLENYRRICFVSGIFPGDMVVSDQVHGDRVLAVDARDRGKGMMKPERLEKVDGLITDTRELCLVTFYADCVPLFFLDPVRKVIGLSHAGWRGTALEIGRKTVEKMTETYGCKPENILAGIGPSIGPCCYEVREDVASFFPSVFVRPTEDKEKFMLDLWGANEASLLRAGLLKDHITVTDLCTKCHPEYFHSHRHAGTRRGTQAAFLELK